MVNLWKVSNLMNPDIVLPSGIPDYNYFLWVFLGWWLGRANTVEDHMLAGRNVGMGLAVATAVAKRVTSNTTMTAPQLAYQLGIWGMLGYSLDGLLLCTSG